jgi:uncharacterized protein YwqG
MKILNQLFKLFSSKGKKQKKVNLDLVLEGEPQTLDDIELLFKAADLEQYIDRIKPLVRSKIILSLLPAEESEIDIAKSKIGGLPHLPKEETYPTNELGKSLSFIGQINLEEVTDYDDSGLLPKTGLLSFFYCADQEVWGFEPNNKQRFKVIYFDNTNELVRYDFPIDLEPHSIFKPNLLSFTSSLSLPSWDDDGVEDIFEAQDWDNYLEISLESDNQMLGYANNIQGSMELTCQLVTNGIDCGGSAGYKDPRRSELEKDKHDWILLLQMDSDEDKTRMMWGDGGRIYFWLKKQDLLNKDFDKAWCILQCY